MFQVGDTVVHPQYGAGVVTEIRERRSLGDGKRYYSIELLGQAETVVMVPVKNEKEVGLRPPIMRSRLSRLWRILRADPKLLPVDHDERYELLKEKLRGGNIFDIAEVVRDLAWRREQKRRLTIRGKRLYDRGVNLLASEIAGVEGEDLEAAETQISDRLEARMASSVIV